MGLLQQVRNLFFKPGNVTGTPNTNEPGAPIVNVQQNPVVIYSSSYCGFCHRAKALLAQKSVDFQEISVDGNARLRAEMSEKSGRRTVPQIWIGESHVGGCDELYQLDRSGGLDVLLTGGELQS